MAPAARAAVAGSRAVFAATAACRSWSGGISTPQSRDQRSRFRAAPGAAARTDGSDRTLERRAELRPAGTRWRMISPRIGLAGRTSRSCPVETAMMPAVSRASTALGPLIRRIWARESGPARATIVAAVFSSGVMERSCRSTTSAAGTWAMSGLASRNHTPWRSPRAPLARACWIRDISISGFPSAASWNNALTHGETSARSTCSHSWCVPVRLSGARSNLAIIPSSHSDRNSSGIIGPGRQVARMPAAPVAAACASCRTVPWSRQCASSTTNRGRSVSDLRLPAIASRTAA